MKAFKANSGDDRIDIKCFRKKLDCIFATVTRQGWLAKRPLDRQQRLKRLRNQ